VSRSRLPAWRLLPWLLLSTGCGAGPAVLVRQEVPPTMLACQAEPLPPEPQANDQALALWIVDVVTAGNDCRNRLRHVKELLHGN